MDFFQKMTQRFTIRGKALAQVKQGMECAKKNEPEDAVTHYTEVIGMVKTPADVKAMALFNRALVYASIGKESNATEDLNVILSMSETLSAIKTAAREKIVRMQRKLDSNTN